MCQPIRPAKPYIFFLAMFFIFLFHTSALAHPSWAEEVLYYVNVERRSAGLHELKLADDLMDMAAVRAAETVVHFSHQRPDGTRFYTAIQRGRYKHLGENLASGQATGEEVVRQWMTSPEHRANILAQKFFYMGVGLEYRDDGTYQYYWAQEFGGS